MLTLCLENDRGYHYPGEERCDDQAPISAVRSPEVAQPLNSVFTRCFFRHSWGNGTAWNQVRGEATSCRLHHSDPVRRETVGNLG